LLGPNRDEIVDPAKEPAATRNLPAQRTEFEMGVRVHQSGHDHTVDTHDAKPSVVRQDVSRRTDIHDSSDRVYNDSSILDRRRIGTYDCISVH
jgi:hypothetical protein